MMICSKCKLDKPPNAFCGKSYYCKPCDNEYRRARYAAIPAIKAKKVAAVIKHQAANWATIGPYQRQWAKNNPIKKNIAAHRRRARQLGQFVENVDRQAVFEMHGGMCGICEEFIQGKFHVDHVIPLSKGGLHCYANVQPAHPNCNRKKWANT
jgi:5-methylcytosine-specific restriction endonuclease McrA